MSTRESRMARREYLKSRHRCVKCTKQDAWTLIGKWCCAECAEKNKEESQKYRSVHRDIYIASRKNRYERLKAEGRCPKCGRENDRNDRVTCSWCAARQRRVDQRLKPVKNIDRGHNGLCWLCNEAPCDHGSKMCRVCHAKMAQVAIQNQVYINRGAHPWRKL